MEIRKELLNDTRTRVDLNISTNNDSIRKQLFMLNNLSIEELRLKWFELLKTNPTNYKRVFLIRGLAYKIQSLAGMSNVSEEELNYQIKVEKSKLQKENNQKAKNVIMLPPAGSVIQTIYKNKEYVVKVIDENKFQYEDRIYKSLSAIASEIAGTRWSGYSFFKLKKKIIE